MQAMGLRAAVAMAELIVVALRRQRNNWWKCRRSYLTLLCSGLSSRPLTFRFLRIGGGSCGGLQGLRAGQGTPAADVEQTIEIPVPLGRRGKGGGPQGSLPGQNSTAAFVEQIVDLPARGGLQGFRQGQGSSSSRLLHAADEGFQGFFRTFPRPKKSAEVTRQSSPRVPASVSSSELSAHQMALAREPDELAEEPGDSLDAALADLQRWRRGLRRGAGGAGG